MSRLRPDQVLIREQNILNKKHFTISKIISPEDLWELESSHYEDVLTQNHNFLGDVWASDSSHHENALTQKSQF